MRAIAVASCIGIGLVLQGCGGGGQDKVCLAEKMDVVSQTISGTIELSTETTVDGTTVTTTQMGNFVEMFDLEQFNLREDGWANGKVTVGNKTMTVSSNTTQIVNITAKQAISYQSVDVDGEVTKSCVIEQLPADTPEPAQLKFMWLSIKPTLQKTAKCGGNDGTYDTWKFDKSFDGTVPQIPNSPMPELDGLTIKDGKVSEEMQMTQDHLLHSSHTSVSGELLNGSVVLGNTKSTVSMTITDVKVGGPSPTDLDPSQFDVDCTPANTTVDMKAFSRSPGFGRQQLLRIMEASKESQDILMV